MRILALATLAAAAGLLATGARPRAALACSADPEQFDKLVQAADVVAIVRAEAVGPAYNTAPTVQPTFTPFPQTTPPPYPLEDLAGIGATVTVVETIVGSPADRLVVDVQRRARIERDERELEAVWPGFASSCSVRFLVPSYEPAATYVALYGWTGTEFETTGLVSLSGDALDPSRGISFSVPAYERYFADIPARIQRSVPAEPFDFAYIEQPTISLDRFLGFIRSVRGQITPPDTGSAGLLPSARH